MSNYNDQYNDKYWSNYNDKYKNMLNVIDIFSEYAWSRPLKKKTGVDVAKVFEQIIKDAIRVSPNQTCYISTRV